MHLLTQVYGILTNYLSFTQNITTHLERDVRKVIMDVLTKSCDYTCQKYPKITDVEFSCQSYVSCVTFRWVFVLLQHPQKRERFEGRRMGVNRSDVKEGGMRESGRVKKYRKKN